MATIQDLLELEMDKVQPASLRESVKGILEDYNEIKDKGVFEKEAASNIDKIYMMVTKVSPGALPANPCEDPMEKKQKKKSKASTKKGGKASVKKDSKTIAKRSTRATAEKSDKKSAPKTASKKDIDKAMEEIKKCRLKIRTYNEQKRKEEGPKPKPSPYAKIKGHFVSLGNLIPERLKDDLEVQKESKRLLKNTHRSLLKLYQMNALKGQKDNEELKERYEKIEEKLEMK